MRIAPLALATPALLALLIAGCGSDDAKATAAAEPAPSALPATSPAEKPPQAPDFTLDSVQGGKIRLADYEGKVVLLDFWATWCGPCKASIPHLNALYSEHKEKGFEVLGISVDQDRPGRPGAQQVVAFSKRFRMDYPLAMANGPIVQAYGGIRSIPTAFLIDRAGRVRKKYVGLRPKSDYEKDVAALLSEPAPKSTSDSAEESI